MLSCRDITDLATEYEEGAMEMWASLGFRLHLAMCTHCRRYVLQLAATTAALRALRSREPGLSPEVQESLMTSFRASSLGLLLCLGVAVALA